MRTGDKIAKDEHFMCFEWVNLPHQNFLQQNISVIKMFEK
jgi:hypothetical protein